MDQYLLPHHDFYEGLCILVQDSVHRPDHFSDWTYNYHGQSSVADGMNNTFCHTPLNNDHERKSFYSPLL
jgi:hypothetical protein